jgi:cation-transporting ATPase 13A1
VKLNLDLAPDEVEEFVPNIVNSTVYIIAVALQVATVAVNYKGHPFMESLRENRLLTYAIMFSTTIVICLTLGIVPDLLTTFEIIDFEPDVSIAIVNLMDFY